MNAKNINSNFIDPGGIEVFSRLVSCDTELKSVFENYLKEYYYDGDFSYRMKFQDMDKIGEFILKKLSSNQTIFLPVFFSVVEKILLKADKNETGLIVVGLFERLSKQTKTGMTNSHFNEWLGPCSKKAWDDLIEFWNQKIEKPHED